MNKKKLFVFNLDNQLFAIDMHRIERIIRAVEIKQVTADLDLITGVINVHGKIVPVINIRKKFNLQNKEISIEDTIVILKVLNWTLALVIDSVYQTMEMNDNEIIYSKDISPHLQKVEGIIKIKGDIVVLHDLEKLFSLEESVQINSLLKV